MHTPASFCLTQPVGSWQALRPAAAEEGGRIPTPAPVRQQEEVPRLPNARMQVYNEILAFQGKCKCFNAVYPAVSKTFKPCGLRPDIQVTLKCRRRRHG